MRLSPNTTAILLLTAPLMTGRSKGTPNLLTSSEYKRLAKHLRAIGCQPADLLKSDADHLLTTCSHVIEPERLKRLLARSFLLAQAVERWHSRSIWVVSRADASYPQRLKSRLKEDSPIVLYGCGEQRIADTGGLAVVGSRKADDALVDFTRAVASLAASAKRTVVSGGAKGIDQAAMRGALDGGGRVTGVLADSLERTAMNREHRNLLLEDQLVLVSPYDPSAGFNVGHAMQRNKVIYALSDAALVVTADFNKGGTWAGAIEQLDKLHLVPIYVRSTGETGDALEALRKKGALPWPNPQDADEFNVTLFVESSYTHAARRQSELFSPTPQHAGIARQVRQVPLDASYADDHGPEAAATSLEPADELFEKVRLLALRVLEKPRTTSDLAAALSVNKRQAEEWVRRLVKDGWVEKRGKPVKYVVRQIELFNSASSDATRAAASSAAPHD